MTMASNNNQNTRVNLRNKLSLKKSNSDSTQSTLSSKIISCSENDTTKTDSCKSSMSQDENTGNKPNVEDSLADFKSPKEEKVSKPIFNKFKFDKEKVKKKLIKTKSKSTKPVIDTNQPSIESSFFKPQTSNQPEVKEAYPCPLCLKPFKDDVTCITHMKACAAKNKVSLQQLLDAKKLQERQAEERKALGLLAAPIIPEKKKTFRSKNYTTNDDPQLQLVLAMSESLYEAEQQQELEQAAVLAGIPSECLKDINAEERKTLQGFGFLTNKPVVEAPARQTKKRKLHGLTVLQSRSKEDKDRVLTERIACIITGDDALTQAQADYLINSSEKVPTQLRSRKLRSIEQLNNKLWDFSRLTKKYNNFYVEELKSHFLKTDEQKNRRDSEPLVKVLNETNESNVSLNDSMEYEPVDIELLVSQNKDSNLIEMTETDSMSSELDFINHSNSNWVHALNSNTKSDIIIFVKNNKEIYAHQLVLFVQCPQILHSKEPNDSLRGMKIKEKISWLTRDQFAALAFLEFIYCGCICKNVEVFDKEDLLNEVRELAKKYDVKNLLKYINIKQNERKLSKSKTSHINKYRRDSSHPNNVHTDQSPTHLPVQQLRIAPPKKVIPFENYKQTQGLPVITDVRHTPNSVHIVKRTRETQTDILVKTEDKAIQTLKNDGIIRTNYEKSNKNTERTSKSAELSCVNTKETSTPVSHCKPLLKNRFTSSPVLFESEDESICGLPPQKSNQLETSHNNTYLNILVDLANENDEMNAVSHSEKNQQIKDSQSGPGDFDSENSQNTIVNSSQSPKNLENPSSPAPENIHNRLTPENKKEIIARNKVSANNQSINTTPETIISSKTNHLQVMEVIEIDSDDEDSIHNAVTPPKRQSVEIDPKNDLELDSFLRKVRRKNARDILESDSESDISIPQAVRKNPFLTKNRDDSYKYLKTDGKNVENKKVISILERDISKDEKLQNARKTESSRIRHSLTQSAVKNQNENISVNENFEENDDLQIINNPHYDKSANDTALNNTKDKNENTSNYLSSDHECSNVTVNESDMSMYSKYKKHNEADNSIHKYRCELNLGTNKNSSEQQLDDSSDKGSGISLDCSSKRILEKNNLETKTKTRDVTLVYDSDEEELNTSKSITQRKKRNSKQFQFENSNLSNIDLVDQQISKIMNSSKDEIIDISNDSDEENSNNCSSKNNSGLFTNRKYNEKEKSLSKEINTNKNDDCGVVNTSPLSVLNKCNKQVDENLSELQSKDYSKNKSNESNKCNNLYKNNDIDSLDNEWFHDLDHYDNWSARSQTDMTKKKSQSPALTSDKFSTPTRESLSKNLYSEFDSPQSPPIENRFSKSNFPLSQLAQSSKNVKTSRNQYSKFDSPQSPPTENKFTKSNSSLSESTDSSKNVKVSSIQYSELDSPQSPPLEDYNESSQNVRMSTFSPSPILSQNKKKTKAVRKLQTKSVSTSNFETPPKTRMVQKCHEYEDAIKNLSTYDTPQLHKELKKFGMKPQNRKNSKLLLSHVYTGMAKQKCENFKTKKRILSDDLSSEDEKPPRKKQNVTETSKKILQKKKINQKKI